MYSLSFFVLSAFLVTNCVCFTSLLVPSLFKSVSKVHQNNRQILESGRVFVPLFAKKKSKTLISDDFLASFTEEIAEESDSSANNDVTVDQKQSKKKKKKGADNSQSKENVQVVENIEEEVQSAITDQSSSQVDESLEIGSTSDVVETVEQRVRRERPPSRVRFAESSQPGFVMMGLEQISLAFGNVEVLVNISFSVSTGERVGLVGPNGSGKTTQLRILAGDLPPTSGTIVKSSQNLRVSFLRQEFLDSLNPNNTLKEELYSTFVEEQQILDDIAACENEVANSVGNEEQLTTILDKLQSLQEKAISKGVYSMNSKVEKIMGSMGFSSNDADAKINTFSGGWKMRIGLAKILLEGPNIVLLDEPTNHLDLDSVFWLEDFLIKQSIPMVIVSHDREFLDRVCNKIVDTEDGHSVSYDGNYSRFLELRRQRLDIWRDKYEKQLKYVKEEEKNIKKAKGDPSQSHVVTAKEAALEKLRNSDEWVRQPPKDKKFRFRFPPAPRCGQSMIEVSKLCHGYSVNNSKVSLFRDVNIQIDRGDRIGFVGPNGVGKSTLMRIIAGNEDPLSGYSEVTSDNVIINYFEQSTADSLDLSQTVFESVQDVAPLGYSGTDIRTLLGQFMFKGDDADKKIASLSGGEKGRVSLCRMMLKPANLLLLDEPTNHLDIVSKEVLEEALQYFEGSLLVISHDRYFMSQVAKQIFSFENQTVVRHDCDYHDFLMKNGDDLKQKIESRYVEGDSYRITNAKEVFVPQEIKVKRNFGGSGVTSGNLNKGIKNAKRYQS